MRGSSTPGGAASRSASASSPNTSDRSGCGGSTPSSVAQRVAGGHRVRDPGRHPHLVLDHPEATVGRAHHVESRERDPARRRGAAHRGLVVGRGLHVLAREHARLEHAALAVHVGHERLQRAQALHDAGLELRPLGLGEDARHRVEREDAVGRGPEAHAASAQAALDLGGGLGGIAERLEQLRVVRARLPVFVVRLVVGARGVRGLAHAEPRTRSPLGSNSGSLVDLAADPAAEDVELDRGAGLRRGREAGRRRRSSARPCSRSRPWSPGRRSRRPPAPARSRAPRSAGPRG